MVVIGRPATDPAGCWQARTGSPSTSTVQAPHAPSPQPGLAPVSPRSSRSAQSSDADDDTGRGDPLTTRLSCGSEPGSRVSATSHRTDDEQRLGTGDDFGGQGSVERQLGEILLTGEESDEGAPIPGDAVSDRAAQRRVARFQGVKRLGKCHRPASLLAGQPGQLDLAADTSQG